MNKVTMAAVMTLMSAGLLVASEEVTKKRAVSTEQIVVKNAAKKLEGRVEAEKDKKKKAVKKEEKEAEESTEEKEAE